MSCPEMHAEVWDVLPVPPTDAAAHVDKEPDVEIRVAEQPCCSAVPAAASVSMPPPALLPMVSKRKAAADILDTPEFASKTNPQDEDDSDDEAMQLAEALMSGSGMVMGCAMPPAEAVAASQETITIEDVTKPISLDADLDASITGRPPCLDSDDEADLADCKEDIKLPSAPAELPEPTAKDLDLDMFG